MTADSTRKAVAEESGRPRTARDLLAVVRTVHLSDEVLDAIERDLCLRRKEPRPEEPGPPLGR